MSRRGVDWAKLDPATRKRVLDRGKPLGAALPPPAPKRAPAGTTARSGLVGPDGGTYECHACGTRFGSWRTVEKHVDGAHRGGGYRLVLAG